MKLKKSVKTMKDILTRGRRKKTLTSPGDLQCCTEDESPQVSITSTVENHQIIDSGEKKPDKTNSNNAISAIKRVVLDRIGLAACVKAEQRSTNIPFMGLSCVK